jgi:hypothetical protein
MTKPASCGFQSPILPTNTTQGFTYKSYGRVGTSAYLDTLRFLGTRT